MGGPTEASTRGRKRSLDVNVNLVPYIDMLMTIMGFLMMTAVWTRFAALEMQLPGTATTKTTTETHAISVFLATTGVRIQDEGEPPFSIAAHDWQGVRAELSRVKAARPDREILQLHVDDGVSLDNVTRTIDIATALKLAVSLEGV
jgi:biopolymer transport protein ExbD